MLHSPRHAHLFAWLTDSRTNLYLSGSLRFLQSRESSVPPRASADLSADWVAARTPWGRCGGDAGTYLSPLIFCAIFESFRFRNSSGDRQVEALSRHILRTSLRDGRHIIPIAATIAGNEMKASNTSTQVTSTRVLRLKNTSQRLYPIPERLYLVVRRRFRQAAASRRTRSLTGSCR
jgi:plasmid stability protein